MTESQSTINLEELKNKWREEQLHLQTKLILNDDELSFSWCEEEENFKNLSLIGGVDLSFHPTDPQLACANLVILNYPELKVIHKEFSWVQLTQPYISGYLAFREVDPLKQLIDKLRENSPNLVPQVIFVDGNGIYHPMKMGLASHLGVLADIPTIGVSKNYLYFDDMSISNDQIKEKLKGFESTKEYVELTGKSGFNYGAALKPKLELVNPIFVSIGHKASLSTTIKLVMATSLFRIPEPTRQADLISRQLIRDLIKEEQSKIN